MDSDISMSLDRISSLPDSILCHILSFLPTKYAVGTSILSTRWQYLWTYVASFDFNDSELLYEASNYDEDELDSSFMKFVNKVLFLSDAPCWKKFSLRLRSFCNLDLVNTWVSAAIKRNVQKMELSYFLEDKYNHCNPAELPRMIFTSKTLVDLTLNGISIVKLPASVWLPSLKILNLEELQYEKEESAWKLFAGCPVLEELYISACLFASTPQVLNISVPTLKRLTVFLSADGLCKSNDQRYKLVVNAPKLEHLHLSDSLTEDFSLENLSSLVEAIVTIRQPDSWSHRSTNYDSSISKLLSAIANVKFLNFQTVFFKGVLLLPTFDNLTRLKFVGLNSWNLDMLREFLEHSPNLEVLILEGTSVFGSAKPWSPPPQVPYCLLFHLKEVEILKFYEKNYGLGEIEYLLKNAIVLKKMTIDCQYPESCFCKTLAGFPRGSKTCQLNLPH